MASSVGVESRLRGALWGLFAGDALASPTHWYYGGSAQIERDYGGPITGYTKPRGNLSGSIMNKSNLNGGGRGRWEDGRTIIGDVINHGKKDLWHPSKSVHYHSTLAAGENTLEAQLCRVLMRSIVQTGGRFEPESFRAAYMAFMTTPGSHNDAYASTCHRMFFANLEAGVAPADCPDNDGHNVDTIDGLVLPTIVALAAAAQGLPDDARHASVAACAAVTRASPTLERSAALWSDVLARVVGGSGGGGDLASVAEEAAAALGVPGARRLAAGRDPVVSWYLEQSLPSLLVMALKHGEGAGGVWSGLLANANAGGENVHRGATLGAALGAHAGDAALGPLLVDGLAARDELAAEIEDFVRATTSRVEADADATPAP